MTLRRKSGPIMQVTVHLKDIMEGADDYNRAWEEVISIKHAPVCASPPRYFVKGYLSSVSVRIGSQAQLAVKSVDAEACAHNRLISFQHTSQCQQACAY